MIAPWIPRIVNVHVDDMLAARHEHLPLGTGDVDFAPLLAALVAGGYSGGLQFAPSTWTGHGGGQYAPSAHLATREQQIAIAEKVRASQGWGAWPACTSKLGLR